MLNSKVRVIQIILNTFEAIFGEERCSPDILYVLSEDRGGFPEFEYISFMFVRDALDRYKQNENAHYDGIIDGSQSWAMHVQYIALGDLPPSLHRLQIHISDICRSDVLHVNNRRIAQ